MHAPAVHRHEQLTLDDWQARMQRQGLRLTQGRIETVKHLMSHPHSSATDTHEALVTGLPKLTLQSVHNIMNDLTACGILRRVDLPGTGGALYEMRGTDNHHHVQCIVCHRIEDVDCAVGEAPCLHPSDTHGMRIVEAAVTFRGLCATCEEPPTRNV